jgi:hypothetical protein
MSWIGSCLGLVASLDAVAKRRISSFPTELLIAGLLLAEKTDIAPRSLKAHESL